MTVDLHGTRTFEIDAESEDELEAIIEEIGSIGFSDQAELTFEEIGPDGSGVSRE